MPSREFPGGQTLLDHGMGYLEQRYVLPSERRRAVCIDKGNDGRFRGVAKQGRLIGAMYFAWDTDPWAKKVDLLSIYR